MTMFFAKKLNKKGFTLAEMLIVVAIIAILVAIAVPIFTTQLDKARKARDEANFRNLKAAALVELLDDSKGYDLSKKSWKIEGTVTSTGQIKIWAITGSNDAAGENSPAAGKVQYVPTMPNTKPADAANGLITVYLTNVEVANATTTS